MPTQSPLRSPLHTWHRTHGARLVESDGWEVPAAYAGPDRKTGLALVDLSSFAKLALRGSGVLEWTHALVGDGAASKPLGVSRLDGGTLACRLTAEHLLLLAAGPKLTLPHPQGEVRCSARDMHTPFTSGQLLAVNQTSAFASFSLVGPHAEALLRRLTHLDFLPQDGCVQTKLAGVAALLVRVQELTVPSLRLLVTWDLGEFLWESLLAAGDVQPLGLDGCRGLRS